MNELRVELKPDQKSWVESISNPFWLKRVELSTSSFTKKELSCEWVIVCLKIKDLSWSMLSLEGMSWVELLTKSDVSELSWIELVEYQEWKRVELNSTHFIEKNWIELNLMKHWKRIEVSWVSIESSKE